MIEWFQIRTLASGAVGGPSMIPPPHLCQTGSYPSNRCLQAIAATAIQLLQYSKERKAFHEHGALCSAEGVPYTQWYATVAHDSETRHHMLTIHEASKPCRSCAKVISLPILIPAVKWGV
jgi:hypothetical protein